MKRAHEWQAIKPASMWAVTYGNGWIDWHSVRRTRAQAIHAFCDDPAAPDWDYWRRTGCRAIRVTVAPQEGGDNA